MRGFGGLPTCSPALFTRSGLPLQRPGHPAAGRATTANRCLGDGGGQQDAGRGGMPGWNVFIKESLPSGNLT